jgi:hypothetical protein
MIPATLGTCQKPSGAANRILPEARRILPAGAPILNELFPSRQFWIVLKCLAI